MTRKLSDSVTYDAAITAMTLWELVLEDSDAYPGVDRYRAGHGVCETRDRVFSMAEEACAIWDVMHEEGWAFDAPFDFEFLPIFLKVCTNAVVSDGEDLGCTVSSGMRRTAAFHLWKRQQAEDELRLAEQNIRAIIENPIAPRLVGPQAPVKVTQ